MGAVATKERPASVPEDGSDESEAQPAKGGGKASAAELREEAGDAVGDMPPGDPVPELPPETVRVKGSEGGIVDMGGKLPQSAVLKISAKALEIMEGEAFRKGTVIYFSGVARVVAVGQKDKLDANTALPIEAVQEHTARVTDLVVEKIVAP